MGVDRRDDPTEHRRRVSVRIATDIADRAATEAKRQNIGIDLVHELALRMYLDVVDRDRRNPRPSNEYAEHTHPFDADTPA